MDSDKSQAQAVAIKSSAVNAQPTDQGKIWANGSEYLSKDAWTIMQQVTASLKMSDGLPKHLQGKPADILATLLTGYEMNMTPMRAFQGLYIVNGQVNVWGKETTRRLREHGYIISYDETADKCTATVTNKVTGEEYSDTFYFEAAEMSGWTKDRNGKEKPGWKRGQNRRLKMRYGALSAIIKSFIPEVMGSAGDIQEIAEDAQMTEIKQIESSNTRVKSTSQERQESLQSFLKQKQEKKDKNVTKSKEKGGEKPDTLKVARSKYIKKVKDIFPNEKEALTRIKKFYNIKNIRSITAEQFESFGNIALDMENNVEIEVK
jgi:hypothetical protein